jgi:hypothetical protein
MSDNERSDCDCSADHPGILWPWGSDGEFPPALPYVERCNDCQRYPSDDAAVSALCAKLLAVGLCPVIGEHVERAVDDYTEWVRLGRPERRIGVYAFPSPAAINRTTGRGDWEVYLAAAKSSLALAASDEIPERPRPEVYVVRPDDASEDVAVFAREEDAEAFRATFEHVGDVEHAIICDPELAARMIADRETGGL